MFIMIKRMLLINHRDVVIYCDDFREGGRMYVTVSDESWSFRFGKFCSRSLLLLKGLIACLRGLSSVSLSVRPAVALVAYSTQQSTP
jgi:hypothetical protein